MIQVVNRAIDILEYVADDYKLSKKPKQLSHIALHLNLNIATCANIVKTLVIRGYLKKAENERGYLIGAKLFSLAAEASIFEHIIMAADSEMEKITKVLHENTLLAVLRGENRVIIHRKLWKQLIEANTPDEKKAMDSSTGRLLVAMLKDAELKSFISSFGLPPASIWPGANTKNQFMDQIEAIRIAGYALIEDSVQIVGIATPIYKNGDVVASLSIYMPAFRFNEDMRKKMIDAAVVSARRVSDKINAVI